MHINFRHFQKLLAVFSIASASLLSHSATNDYDGKWSATITCGVNSLNGRPGFTNNTDFTFNAGKINEVKTSTTQLGKDENSWSGQIENGKMTLIAAGKRDSGGTWEWKFSGNATSNEAIALSGAMYAEGKQIRDCSVQMSLAMPASTSLAAKAKNTAQLTPSVSTAASTSKPSTIEKSEQNIGPTSAPSKPEQKSTTIDASRQNQNLTTSNSSSFNKSESSNNSTQAAPVESPKKIESGEKQESITNLNTADDAATEQPTLKVEVPVAASTQQKATANGASNINDIFESNYLKYGIIALLAIVTLWVASWLIKKISKNVKDAATNFSESKNSIKQEFTSRVIEAKSSATEKLNAAKAAASQASVMFSDTAAEASRLASKKIEENSSNIEKVREKLKSILGWFSKIWAPYKEKILQSKFGIKYPRAAKIISNGWVLTLFIIIMSGGNSSDPYDRYNNSKDYKSCINAAKAAGRKLAKENGTNERGTILSLQSSCEQDGTSELIESHQSVAEKASNPSCINQMREAKNSCMGTQGNSSIYFQCLRNNAPACN